MVLLLLYASISLYFKGTVYVAYCATKSQLCRFEFAAYRVHRWWFFSDSQPRVGRAGQRLYTALWSDCCRRRRRAVCYVDESVWQRGNRLWYLYITDILFIVPWCDNRTDTTDVSSWHRVWISLENLKIIQFAPLWNKQECVCCLTNNINVTCSLDCVCTLMGMLMTVRIIGCVLSTVSSVFEWAVFSLSKTENAV